MRCGDGCAFGRLARDGTDGRRVPGSLFHRAMVHRGQGGRGALPAVPEHALPSDQLSSCRRGALPPILKITLADIPGGDWIARSFVYAASDLANGGPGAATVMSKMSELLF